MCELAVFICLVILALSIAGTFTNHAALVNNNLFVPQVVTILAGITAILGLTAYFWSPKKYAFITALSVYAFLCLTTGTLVQLTGGTHSIYVALWMLLIVFAGVFGNIGLVGLFIATNIAFVANLLFLPLNYGRSELTIFFLAFEIPIGISFVIWNDRGTQDTTKTKTISALTQQLSEVANKSEIVINSIADGVIVIDEKGAIQLINPAGQELLGWPKQDAIGLDYRSVVKLVDKKGNPIPEVVSPIHTVMVTNKSLVNNDLAIAGRSGKIVSVSLMVSPVVSNQTTEAGIIIVLRDITDEKQQEQAKAEFISTASHEMRTPVAAIEGYIGLALNPATAVIDDKARSYLLKAHESTEHLGRLFQDLLTISRSEDGRLQTKPIVIDIIAFVRDLCDSLIPKAQQKGLTLIFKPAGSDANKTIAPAYYVFADADQFREVINNLLDNAIKYTKEGSVTVDITGDPQSVTLSISDSGIGVPPEDIPHLFQKFYRVDNSSTREIGGTGLGLYICRRLVETNNGRIWMQSEFGKGSTFFIKVPRISSDKVASLNQQQTISPTPGVSQ